MTEPGSFRAKILFVDDEPDFESLIRQRFRRQLREAKLDLVFAGDGVEALEKLAADDSIGLVFSDINMPRMDGLTLLKAMRGLDRDIVVVIISAYGDIANIRVAMNEGSFDFLTKPIDFADLDVTLAKSQARVVDIAQKIFLRQEAERLTERTHFLESTFGRYLDQTVVKELLAHPDALKLGGERRDLSILFADLRGFSALAERHAPERIVSTLNEYLSAMIHVILEHGGMVNEILGDGILAIFGAPLPQADHARRAVACAVAMQWAMSSVNSRNASNGLPRLEMGIGVNTGEAIVGNIGSSRRAKYGVVGCHVNLSARVESTAVGGQVVISEYTLAACGADFVRVTAPVELIAKGFEEKVTIYDVTGVGEPYSLDMPSTELELNELAAPLPICFGPAMGVAFDEAVRRGSVSSLGLEGARVCCDEDAAVLGGNVKLSFLKPNGEVAFANVYGKVRRTSAAATAAEFTLRFVALSADVESFIRQVLAAARSN